MDIQITWDLVKNGDSESVDLGWDLKFCTSHKLPESISLLPFKSYIDYDAKGPLDLGTVQPAQIFTVAQSSALEILLLMNLF